MTSGPQEQAQHPVSRILIYGVTGSGKTTLARRMGESTGLPWHSVDDLTWEPGWVAVPFDEQRRRIEEICAGEEWILDTAYGAWREIPLDRAQLIVALDYPRLLSLSRLVRRTLARLVDQRTICNGNRETVRTLFARDSIVVWHFRSFRRKRARMRAWSSTPDGPAVHRFTSPRQLEDWLRHSPHPRHHPQPATGSRTWARTSCGCSTTSAWRAATSWGTRWAR
ncbi:MAG: adenylate kinase [Pseudonocardia sp.]